MGGWRACQLVEPARCKLRPASFRGSPVGRCCTSQSAPTAGAVCRVNSQCGRISPIVRGAAAMQQVADWLENLGLGQYAQRFAENDIDFSVLPHLTDADLEKIGVSLGHRRKILAAIAELAGSVQSPPQPVKSEPKPRRDTPATNANATY
jgi:hypothetical protein